MANRFDVGTPQKYVSIYPFQELAAIGEKLNARAAQTQQKMSAVEDAISKVDVADQVLVEGSSIGDTYNPGIQWASTGYTQFKNNLLNTVKTGHDDLVRLWQSGEISISDLERESNALNNSILKDYNKLLAAGESSKIIDEVNKEYRKNPNASKAPFILNELARAGSQFIKNPYSFIYTAAPMADLINEEEAANKYASGFKDSDIAAFKKAADENNYITYGKTTGVTRQRVLAGFAGFDDDPQIASQLKQKAYRDIANQMDPNSKEFESRVEKQYKIYKENFINKVLNKAVNEITTYDRKYDRQGEQARLKDELNMLHTSGVIPGDIGTIDIDPAFKNLVKYDDKSGNWVLNSDIYKIDNNLTDENANEGPDQLLNTASKIQAQNQIKDLAKKLHVGIPRTKYQAEQLLNKYLQATKYIEGQVILDPTERDVINAQFEKNPTRFSAYQDGYGKEGIGPDDLTLEERKTFSALSPVTLTLEDGKKVTGYKGTYTTRDNKLKTIYLRDTDTKKNQYVDIYAKIKNNSMRVYKPDFEKYVDNNPDYYKNLNESQIKQEIANQLFKVEGKQINSNSFFVNDFQRDPSGKTYYTIVKSKDDGPLNKNNLNLH